MTGHRFCHYELRTTQVQAARAFYSELLGNELWGPRISVTPLPEAAAARGAPAHWLGHIGVSDVEATAARMIALGAQRLGPTRPNGAGLLHAPLRDPAGAVVAVGSLPLAAAPDRVCWHILHTPDPTRSAGCYAGLLGWGVRERIELNGFRLQGFAWDEPGPNVGSIVDIAGLAHIHPHWLFCFGVSDIESALGRAQALGGRSMPPATIEKGAVIAACDDPQGAAFGLYQPAAA